MNLTDKLSPHFTYGELIHSDYALRKGLNNTPPKEAIDNLYLLCEYVLEPIRELMGVPIQITSAYRSRIVNRGIGGALKSQHIEGKAADFVVPGVHPLKVVMAISESHIPFDQLIEEFSIWTHISYSEHLRGEVLEAYSEKGRTTYRPLVWVS